MRFGYSVLADCHVDGGVLDRHGRPGLKNGCAGETPSADETHPPLFPSRSENFALRPTGKRVRKRPPGQCGRDRNRTGLETGRSFWGPRSFPPSVVRRAVGLGLNIDGLAVAVADTVEEAAVAAVAERELARTVDGVGVQTPLIDRAECGIRRGKRSELLVILHRSVGRIDVAQGGQMRTLRFLQRPASRMAPRPISRSTVRL